MTTTKEYKITEEHCKTLIKGVCSGCGGQLSPVETVDNSGDPTFWAHCPPCSKYHWGTDPIVYAIASRMVDERNFVAYKFLDSTDPQYRESQISGACSMVSDVLRYFKTINS